jgi:hypothetical protein
MEAPVGIVEIRRWKPTGGGPDGTSIRADQGKADLSACQREPAPVLMVFVLIAFPGLAAWLPEHMGPAPA